MKSLKIACTERTRNYFFTDRETIEVGTTDYTDVAAAVVNECDIESINDIYDTKFGIAIFVLAESDEINDEITNKVHKIIHINELNEEEFSKELNKAADKYEEEMLPPFFDVLSEYSRRGNLQFACPGHQGGQYFVKHPAGRAMYEFFGENIFKSDICNADVDLGDLLIHEGPAMSAQTYAAKVYNADKTYFVMNGTSTSNSVVINAIVSPGDLVLFDRNNHKSVYNSALVSSAGKPVYLETSRNPFGFIGGIDAHCFNEEYLRSEAAKVDSEKAKEKRPFRLAVIQLGTYDGTIYNARQVVDKIGHLCDYILFDSAWVGYEQFIPMMRECSPLLLDLKPEDPGILVTQSIHKQQAGFSQTSQIHKKDSHLKGQKRYVDHKRFNNAYMLYASTSPFYPLFAALDVNARMQDGEAGRKLWADCIKVGVEARKDVLERCELLKPFIPPVVNGKSWQDYDTEEIANNIEFFKFYPGEKWHSFEGYGENQYFVDPNKFMLTTPGINVENGEYEDFGIPATILANYLRDHRVVPEKNDLNSILFLLTPAESTSKMKGLVDHLVRFENLIKEDAPLSEVLPKLYAKYEERYKGYTIRRLCQEMHDFYKKNDAKTYQKLLFRRDSLPEYVMNPNEANIELKRNNAKLVPLSDIVGEIALEGALPYPPGVFCVVPGERWNIVAQKYFSILEEGINRFPGFAPEIQGVYLEKEDGKVRAYGYVLDK
ncbi:ornithine decarboxylase [Clostridium sp.]|uniref:ornithine decarboxylase n=1 Tax=Clostridium sp. TaxID=1506 RepID=UPI002612D4EB|nr:ornithine decarboxylase [Clostridium sp.]